MATTTQSSPYTVSFEAGRRLTQQDWLTVERDQQTEHARRVNAALLVCLDSLGGAGGRGGGPAPGTPSYAVLNEALYEALAGGTPLDRPAAAPAAKGGAKGAKGAKAAKEAKAPKLSASDRIRQEASAKKVALVAEDLTRAVRQGGRPLERFLGHDLYEARALALMGFAAELVSSGGTPAEANELDVAIQKFLEPGTGRSYMDPTRCDPPAAGAVRDLQGALARLRLVAPFDGVRLAVAHPHVIWRTRYDRCLPEAPVRARENQRATLRALIRYARDEAPFLVLNRAPPGAGKSALLVPIAALLGRPGSEARELFVCAGQGRAGVVQFMQALYGAAIPFAAAFLEAGALQIVRQHSNCAGECRVFVGTADAIRRLMAQPRRRGWLIVDEPTYGADLPGSAACADIMALLADLRPENRRVVMLGATLPHPTELPRLVGFFGGRTAEIAGGADSIQIACSVRTASGHPVLPHYGCTSAAEVARVAARVGEKPFLARMYTVSTLVGMAGALSACATAGQGEPPPDLGAAFDRAQNLRPEVVTGAALDLLAFVARQPPATIARVCAPPGPTTPPLDWGRIATREAPGLQAMVVDVDPLGFTREHCAPLLRALQKAGVPPAAALYAAYEKVTTTEARAEAAAESRKAKGLADGEVDAEDSKVERSSRARIGFPEWAQVATAAHRARFGAPSGAEERQAVPPSGVPLCDVPDEVQLLLLAGVGVLSSRAVACTVYQSEVWRRASAGQLALVVTDHSACYGANLLLGTVIITEAFARVASLATLEQAGGRLCRVGRTYSGTLILPDGAASELLAAVRGADGSVTCAEAENMEAAFAAELAAAAPRPPSPPPAAASRGVILVKNSAPPPAVASGPALARWDGEINIRPAARPTPTPAPALAPAPTPAPLAAPAPVAAPARYVPPSRRGGAESGPPPPPRRAGP